ncbi:hypothetical protein HOLleu_09567 [Holothuria leucospilota]|uniref:Uncharacterized protein n=1 Tax=Holothuria leucospilota TaxID=206669 RepID=A0A9Q1CD36_HOLLE|nr:hypothetical protein HOLleu_09567 [Holothuria leucospilota]
MADDKGETPEVEAVEVVSDEAVNDETVNDEAVKDEASVEEIGEDNDEPKVVSSNQSETLKNIVDFEEEASDMNTELFRSTIRTTPLDSQKDNIDVDQLLNPDGLSVAEKNVKSEEAKAKENVEKEALKAARESADEDEEELDVYQGIEEKKESEWTIVRCSSNNSVEDIIEGEDKPDSKMEEEKNSVDEVKDDTDEDKSFEIIDEKEVEECKEDDNDRGTETEEDSGGKVDGDEELREGGINEEEDKSRTVEDVEENLYEVTGLDVNRSKNDNNNEDGEKKIDLEKSGEENLGDKSMPASSSLEENKMEVEEDDKEKEETKDEIDGQNEDAMDTEEAKTEDDTETLEDANRRSLSEFDDIQVSGILDTHAQKSRARLAKTGVLAQRRKPPRSSWYVEDGQKIQEFMFTDSTEPKPLKQVKEEEPPVPSPRTPPKVTARRPPPGAMASPLLLPGLGGNFKLKKTTPSESSSKSQVESKSPPGIKSPTAAKVLPSQKFGARVLPVPAKRPPVAHSKGKAPSPPESKASEVPVKPQRKFSEEKVSPKEPSPTSTVPQVRLPPSTAAKPTVKPRPKPLPKPRPQSIAGTTEPVVQKDGKVKRTSKDDLNSDILNGQKKSPASPRWITDKNKKLPPISPSTKTVPENTNLFQTPKWKQDLLKKKKDAEAAEPQPATEDLSIKKSVVPPSLPKKDEDPNKAPFTTVPQWQLELARKKKMKKEKDEESQEDGVSRHPKEPKTEDSNKVEQEKRKKPLPSPKPAIVPRKKFEAVPPGKDPKPSWQKNLQDKKKNNEKNLLIENGEKKDTEKPAVISPSSKKGEK